MLPIRDGAGVSLSLSCASLAGSVGSAALPPVLSLTLRSGESCGARKPSRTGRNRSGVIVWATAGGLLSATRARHANSARNVTARLRRPVAGPDITMEIPQRIHTLGEWVPGQRTGRPENVVNGVKTIMVNEPLRTGPRVASPVWPC